MRHSVYIKILEALKILKNFLKKYFKRLTVFIRVYIEDIMKLNPDGVLNIITNFGITDLNWYLY